MQERPEQCRWLGNVSSRYTVAVIQIGVDFCALHDPLIVVIWILSMLLDSGGVCTRESQALRKYCVTRMFVTRIIKGMCEYVIAYSF